MKLSARLTYAFPCCDAVLDRTVTRQGPESTDDPPFPSFCAAHLGMYFEQRVKYHDCALVSTENPTGYMPSERRTAIMRAEHETEQAAANRERMEPAG